MAFQAALLDQLRTAPGVRQATLTSHLPMGDYGSGNTCDINVPGYVSSKGEGMAVVTDSNGPEFFRTMGIAMAQGREFTSQVIPRGRTRRSRDQRRHGSPLLAEGERAWQHVMVEKQASQIVGIVQNYAYHNPQDTDPEPVLFLPAHAALPEPRVCGSPVAYHC